jgi:hypothetical protein
LVVLVPGASAGWAEPLAFEYPSAILGLHDADGSCWLGMDASGAFPVRVVPEEWLVGPPPSPESALTLPTDHWIDLAFSGRLAAGDGNDILLIETGKAGEQALLFLTDGADQEYLLTNVVIDSSDKQDLSQIGIDLDKIVLPFVPRAIRLVALDLGGQSPGFDLSNARARVSHETGVKAGCPNPVHGATGVSPYTQLTWTPGYAPNGQTIHLSPVASERVSSERLAAAAPPLPPDANSFEPPSLGLGRTYAWRVDAIAGVDANVVQMGDLWSFTVADQLVIDDFEAYDFRTSLLYETWQTRGWAGVSIEQEIVRSCRQSMSFHYHYDQNWFSEIARTFETPQDWAHTEAQVLKILVRGTAGNSTKGGLLYVALSDGQTEQRVPYAGDLSIPSAGSGQALADPRWSAWRTRLADFDQIDLTNVIGIAIGLRPATTSPQDRGLGTIYLDDITLHPALCLKDRDPTQLAESWPPADLTADCTVDYRDLQQLARDWLYDSARVFAVAAPNEPVLWYDFEGDARDLAGGADGQIHGRCHFVPGVYGQAICFASQGDTVTVPEAAGVFARTREAITIAFWQRGDDSNHLNDTLCCSNYVYGQANPVIAIHLGCWKNPGQYRWDCGAPWSFRNRLAGRHADKGEWAGRWNHWAFTKRVAPARVAGVPPALDDGGVVGASARGVEGVPPSNRGPEALGTRGQDARDTTEALAPGRMEIYLNGELYASLTGTDTPITDITSFEIGSGWYGRYDGRIDDFRIYDYALSARELAHVATRGTGIFPHRPDSPADLNADGTVNLHDLAVLATHWVQNNLWP